MKLSDCFVFRHSRCDAQDADVKARERRYFMAAFAPGDPARFDPALDVVHAFDSGFLRGLEWGLARFGAALADPAEQHHLLRRLHRTDPALFPAPAGTVMDGLPERPGEVYHDD